MDECSRSLIDLLDVADNEAMIASVLKSCGRSWGFEHFAYLQTEGPEIRAVTSYPQKWKEAYLNKRYALIDPVVTEAKRRREMFSWSAEDWPDRGTSDLRKFRDEAIAHGIRTGVTIAVEGSYCSTMMLTFASARRRVAAPKLLDPMDALRIVLAVHYRLELVGAHQIIAPKRALSSREKMCVKWVLKGKTAFETAILTGINMRTVQHYLDSARDKLDARTLPQLIGILKDRGLF